MKKLYLLTCIATVCINLFCQQDQLVLDSIYYYSWEPGSYDWSLSGRQLYFYDLRGNHLEETGYGWDFETNTWLFQEHQKFTCDADGNEIEVVNYDWNTDTGSWNKTGKNVLYWSGLSSAIDQLAEKYCLVYPNPAKEFIRIETNLAGPYLIELYALDGFLKHKSIRQEACAQLDLSAFRSGVYLIRISSKDFVISKKIIKQ